MLSRSVYAFKGFLMEKTCKTMTLRGLLHDFHRQLVIVDSDIRRCVYRCKLMLAWRCFIVGCLGINPEFPQLHIKILHIFGNTCTKSSEIMILELLTFRRPCSNECTSCVNQITAFLIVFFINEKIFLFRPDGRDNPFRLLPEKRKNLLRLCGNSLHASQKRGFLIQNLSGIGAECCRDAESTVFYECIACRIPRGITTGLECRSETT